jgi:hypothetical protein
LRTENQLCDRDWDVLQHLESILTVFETVVKTLEGDGQVRLHHCYWLGSYGNMWDVLFGFELLLSKLEEFKQFATEFPDAEQFRIGVNLAWEKLDKYYRLFDEISIYYTALASHPTYRWDWFEEVWQEKPDWIERAKAIVHDVWIGDYANFDIRVSSRESGNESSPTKRPWFYDPFAINSRITQLSRSIAVIGDEYEVWQRDREMCDGEVRDPLAYWAAKQDRYPRLSRMAMDFLTIQPMSAECERAFSAAGKMVTPTRSSLDAVIIRICQVLRSWYRAGVIPETDADLAPVDLGDCGKGGGDGESEDDDEEFPFGDDRSATSEIDSE